MFVSHAANYPALWWEWGGEEEGEEGLGGSAKAILKLLLTHASRWVPPRPQEWLGPAGRLGGAQCETHCSREPNGGSTALVGQRVKGSNSVDTGQTQDPRVWGPGRRPAPKWLESLFLSQRPCRKVSSGLCRLELSVWGVCFKWRQSLEPLCWELRRAAEKSTGEDAHSSRPLEASGHAPLRSEARASGSPIPCSPALRRSCWPIGSSWSKEFQI